MMSWGGDGMWGQPPAWSVGGWLVVLGLLLLGAAVVLLVVYGCGPERRAPDERGLRTGPSPRGAGAAAE